MSTRGNSLEDDERQGNTVDATTIDAYGGCEKWKFDATGYFRLEQTDDRWWMVDPLGNGFISVALNHAEDVNLKHDYNVGIWKNKYGGKRETWIKEGLIPDLEDWNFNTLGYTVDYVTGTWDALDWHGESALTVDLGHTNYKSWSTADYMAVGKPYCLQLRALEIEDWNHYPAFRDVFTKDFADYIDSLARDICVDHAESDNLIGYFFVDIPAWAPHATGEDFSALKGLDEKERDVKLYDVASKYYETVANAIRKYDSNHLILGDRYNGNKSIPTPVLKAMEPFVDVLSIQYFPSNDPQGHRQMKEDFARWQEICDKPVLNADIGNWCPTPMNPHRESQCEDQAGRARDYIAAINELIDEPWFVGWHWCAHVENPGRGWGIKDPYDQPYEDFRDPVSEYNKNVYDMISASSMGLGDRNSAYNR